jgi:hypothetical protein
MLPVKVNVCGHAVLEDGVTAAVTLVTAKGGKVGVGVELGVGVCVGVGVLGDGQFNVKLACGDDTTFGDRTWTLSHPLTTSPGAPRVRLSGATFCVPDPAKFKTCAGPSVPS